MQLDAMANARWRIPPIECKRNTSGTPLEMQITPMVIPSRNDAVVKLPRAETKEVLLCNAKRQRSNKYAILRLPIGFAPWIVDLIQHFEVDALFIYMYRAIATCATFTM